MIVSYNVLNIKSQSAGRFRCTFNYIFDDGREVNLRPSSVGADYQAVCEARAADVLASVVKSDANDAVMLEIQAAHGYASQAQVFYAYLSKGFTSKDPIEAYDAMNGIAQALLGLGLTTEELAAMLGEPVETAQAVIDLWTFLDSNSPTIEAYRLLRESL